MIDFLLEHAPHTPKLFETRVAAWKFSALSKVLDDYQVRCLLVAGWLGFVGVPRRPHNPTTLPSSAYTYIYMQEIPPNTDPHVVAAALILALRMLPEPLLTFERYHAFLAAGRLVDPSEVRKATTKERVAALLPCLLACTRRGLTYPAAPLGPSLSTHTTAPRRHQGPPPHPAARAQADAPAARAHALADLPPPAPGGRRPRPPQ